MEEIRTQLRMDDKTAYKVKEIAKKAERSMNAQINFIIKQYIADYEKVNGKIIEQIIT